MEKFIKGTLIFAVLLHVAVCGGEEGSYVNISSYTVQYRDILV